MDSAPVAPKPFTDSGDYPLTDEEQEQFKLAENTMLTVARAFGKDYFIACLNGSYVSRDTNPFRLANLMISLYHDAPFAIIPCEGYIAGDQ